MPRKQTGKRRRILTDSKGNTPYIRKRRAGGHSLTAPGSRQVKAVYAPEFNSLTPIAQELVEQILNPADAVNVIRYPGTLGVSAVANSESNIIGRVDASNKTSLFVYPRLQGMYTMTKGAATAFILPERENTISNNTIPTIYNKHANIPQSSSRFLSEPLMIGNGDILYSINNGGTPSYNFKITQAGNRAAVNAQLYRINITHVSNLLNSNMSGAVHFNYNGTAYKKVLDAVNDNSSVSRLYWNVTYDELADIVDGVAATAINLNLITDFTFELQAHNTAFVGAYKVSIDANKNVVVNFSVPNVHELHSVGHITDHETFANTVDSDFVSAQSVLVTSNTNQNTDGGRIAISRIDAFDDIGSSGMSYYEKLTGQPAGMCYDGAVRNGAYCWALGDDSNFYKYGDFQDLSISNHVPYMAAYWELDAAASMPRIKISTIVQFKSNAQFYSYGISPVIQQWGLLNSILSVVDAAYENNSHMSDLASQLKHASRKVIQQAKTYLSNPQNRAQIRRITRKGAGYVAKAAPIIAGLL